MKVCMNKVLLSIAICCFLSGTEASATKKTRSSFSLPSIQQKRNITGIVLDAKTNEPVINATVQIKRHHNRHCNRYRRKVQYSLYAQ